MALIVARDLRATLSPSGPSPHSFESLVDPGLCEGIGGAILERPLSLGDRLHAHEPARGIGRSQPSESTGGTT